MEAAPAPRAARGAARLAAAHAHPRGRAGTQGPTDKPHHDHSTTHH
ncbi:hypothetical protein [Streptomyces sp. MI02-7b]|nr:hypothetical protein [Streptomyces sp. MI02-7b]MDX3078617.1 hypothetical protein [Streptomyces sp. MI02-7b]